MDEPRGPLSALVDEALADLAGSTGEPHVRSQVEALRGGLREPLRVAVAGRVKAGKSTLVNALLRQRVAPTAVGECTRLVTWYRHGDQERAEAVLRSGERHRFALRADGSLPPDLDVDAAEVARLDVHLSIEDLRALTLVDTPGLASADDRLSGATRELLAVDEVSRGAVAQADVLLLVTALEPHHDDVALVTQFDAQFDGLGRNALNAVGVLSRIDHAGVGPEEVGERARELAERFLAHHHLSLAAVVPVNGLLAETTRCGVLTERDVQALAALAALPDATRRLLLLSASRFVEAEAPVSRADRGRLLEVLDLYGVERAVELVASGTAEGPSLSRALLGLSGVDTLEREVFGRFGAHADVFKVGWALAVLRALGASTAAEQRRIAATVERLALEPDLVAVRLLRAVQQQASGDVALPPDLATDLVQLAGTGAPQDRLGLAPAADPEEVNRAVVGAVGRWRSFANQGRAGPAEREVADAVCRALEAMA